MLLDPSYLVIIAGTLMLTAAAGVIGVVSVLKGQSLIGDSIGHASFFGVILAFMITMEKNTSVLMLGAIASGVFAFLLIQVIHSGTKLTLDPILAIVLSSTFGFGLVLKTHIQGNPNYLGASQSGLQSYIFGQAAYMMRADVMVIAIVGLISMAMLVIFYKEIKVYTFDPDFAKTAGFRPALINIIILTTTMIIIAAGLRIVGAVLISSMLIAPGVTALQWSNRFGVVLTIAGFVGGISAVVGTYISTLEPKISTGPSIIVVMSLIAIFSIFFARKGVVATYLRRRGERQ